MHSGKPFEVKCRTLKKQYKLWVVGDLHLYNRSCIEEMIDELVEEIRAMGMPAERAPKGATAQINDILIRGYLISVDEGSKAKRFGIGLGSGASELQTVVDGYQMTAQGRRKLGSAEMDASGGKTPGGRLVISLRQDSFEVSPDAALYTRWYGDQMWMFVPAQTYVQKFLSTFMEFPPSQTVGSLSEESWGQALPPYCRCLKPCRQEKVAQIL